MAGTRIGGLRTTEKVKAAYGEDFYKRIGALGGRAGTGGGFQGNRELASRAGKKGGLTSRRNRRINEEVVAVIRRRISDGEPQVRLAEEYGLTVGAIYNMHTGRSFARSWTPGCICHKCELKRMVGTYEPQE